MLTVFAPRAFSETWFILPNVSNILQLDAKLATDFADAVHRVLRGYRVSGVLLLAL